MSTAHVAHQPRSVHWLLAALGFALLPFPATADFVTFEGKLIVEVDGATHATADEMRRDARRTRALESFGFQVVRVTNTDVYENLEGVLEPIFRELNRD